MFPRLWKFIRNTKNREIISWFGGGIAVVAAGIWAVVVFFFLHQEKPATISPTTVTQSGTGIGSGRDTNVNAPVSIGLDEQKVGQQIAAAQKPLKDQFEKLVDQLAREKGVETAPLRAILVKLGEAGIRDEDIPKRLDEKADELLKLREEIARLKQGPPELASFAQQAQTLIDKGDFEGARAALAEGRAAARKLREQSSGYEADFLAQEAKLEHLQLAYRSAAARYAEAAALIAPFDSEKQWRFVLAHADELYSQGHEFGHNDALREAIAIFSNGLLLAPRSLRPLDWAATQMSLGTALEALGERESGTARLEEAVAAFRAALEENKRERVPLDWAMTQNNIGTALEKLGERESGTARLEEAVAAYRAALEERTRERVPLDWAATKMNLGNALEALGERESGTARLEEAVAAFRAALEENKRERVPLAWAATQNNLGTALWRLGERESGTARLEEAVAAYRAALEERTRERVPLAWAGTKMNLGNALEALGERESGTARLEEAVAAFRAALEENKRERVPLAWAMTQNNLGTALEALGARESGTARLEEAVAAFRAALEENKRERVPLDWAMTQNNLGTALWRLGERESGTARLEEAVAAYNAALAVFAPAQEAYYTNLSQANRDRALALIAQRKG